MLGQAHTLRRRFLPLTVLTLAVLAAPAVGGADSVGHGHTTATLRAENAQMAGKTRAAVLELYALDQRLGRAQSSLASLERQRSDLSAARASLARERALARRSNQREQSRLGSRLQALYEQGSIEPLDVVLGAKNLDDALSGLDNLNRVAAQGNEILRHLKSARRELASTSVMLARRDVQLRAAAQQAQRTAVALTQTRAARSRYLGSLSATRRMNDAQIATLVAQAHAADVRSSLLVADRSTTGGTSPVSFSSSSAPEAIVAGGQAITVSATAYSLPGHTASGLPVGWGIVAVDPSLIPLGTRMTVPGYGEAIAADTGSAIRGATIDLWFPTFAQAAAWGRRTVTIVLH